jgi:ABC-type multidrug transport system ATPase subunit
MVNRTVVVVAHRLSTVKNADAIMVMENGRVLAQGTHQELLKSCATYLQLVKRQLTWTNVDSDTVCSDSEVQTDNVLNKFSKGKLDLLNSERSDDNVNNSNNLYTEEWKDNSYMNQNENHKED